MHCDAIDDSVTVVTCVQRC